jgi:hypothetical protein
MPSLPELQRSLKKVFTHPRGVEAGLAAAGFGRRRPVTALVADQPPVPLRTRLAVYADAYFFRLLETLGQDFAAVKRAAGEALFQRLVAAYLRRHPSRSPFINDAGAAFPAFLARHPAARRLPFLADLAALEWAALRTLFIDRLPPPPPEALAALGPKARLRLDPTVRLLSTRWPVDVLWENRTRPTEEKERTAMRPKARRLLVWRDATWARVRPLEEGEFRVLEELAAGKTLERALRAAGAHATPSTVGGWFTRWTADGVVKGLR